MMTVTVLKPFRDFAKHRNRVIGETFEATKKRAAYIDAKLPGYITYTPIADEPKKEEEPVADPQVDLSKLTVATLKTLAKERGIDVPKGAKKAQIIALLEE